MNCTCRYHAYCQLCFLNEKLPIMTVTIATQLILHVWDTLWKKIFIRIKIGWIWHGSIIFAQCHWHAYFSAHDLHVGILKYGVKIPTANWVGIACSYHRGLHRQIYPFWQYTSWDIRDAVVWWLKYPIPDTRVNSSIGVFPDVERILHRKT